ncbi:MAG TPA: ATP synthase F1 subunit gamma [Candidatus Kryptonia bacterium]|nr:ATP synthase F1 subunit gamma [Candidatus Kryptonia bacterium]
MASLKAIRKRIASVKSTQQITKAMKMVAAAKLRRAQEAVTAARPYAEKLGALVQNVAARVGTEAHPLLAARPEERTIHLLLVSSDRGLCGGYNTNLIRKTEAFLDQHGRDRVRLTIVGRKAYDYYKRRPVKIVEQHINLFGGPNHDLAESIGRGLARAFAAGEVDGVYLLYNQFRSAISQVPTIERLLPLSAAGDAGDGATDYLYEPDAPSLLERLLRQYVTVLIHRTFLESLASFHGAQMTAMDSASKNASDMIDRLTLQMNRARQGAITTELMEIVSGAEALKG